MIARPISARRAVYAALLASALLLGGCGGSPGGLGGGSARPGAAGWAGREDVGAAIALLNKGDAPEARKRLARVLERTPGDTIAAKLLKQIDTPAEALLGGTSFPYKTHSDDTMSSLASRFLGDPMMFYALARYNGIAAPGGILPAGRTLRMPGRDRREPPPEIARSAPSRAATAVAKPSAPAIAKAPPRTAVAADPRRAGQLRAAGLEQLNRGAINRAVDLLGQASRADPSNQLIRRDLDRAFRIQRTVQAQR